MSWNAVVVPSSPLMISSVGAADPLGDVRALAVDAVSWLTSTCSSVVVLSAPADPANVARGVPTPLGERVARSLLSAAGFSGEVSFGWSNSPRVSEQGADSRWSSSPRYEGGQSRPLPTETGVLVVGDGSARRGEKAPGHLDERAFAFDESIEKALGDCDGTALRSLDTGLGAELLAAGTPAFIELGGLPDADRHTAVVDYADDPLGVQYWIVRWQCVS